jgi:MFS family permease
MLQFWYFPVVFSSSDGAMATLIIATFSIAFYRDLLAQPFGHYGDKIGRKFTLVAALLTMEFRL